MREGGDRKQRRQCRYGVIACWVIYLVILADRPRARAHGSSARSSRANHHYIYEVNERQRKRGEKRKNVSKECVREREREKRMRLFSFGLLRSSLTYWVGSLAPPVEIKNSLYYTSHSTAERGKPAALSANAPEGEREGERVLYI